MLLRLKQGKGQPSRSLSFGFPLPSPDCTCDYISEVPKCATHLCGEMFHAAKYSGCLQTQTGIECFFLFLVMLLFIFCGREFPIRFLSPEFYLSQSLIQRTMV